MRQISKLIVGVILGTLLAIPTTARATTLLFDQALLAQPNCGDPPAPCGAFQHFDILLNPANWRVDNWISGATPTDAQFQAVLSNLSAFYILQDWKTAPDIPTTHVDNVVFGSGASSTFESGDETWHVVGTVDPTADLRGQPITDFGLASWDSTSILKNSIFSNDPADGWDWFSAPSAYLGNQTARFGQTLSLDVHTTDVDLCAAGQERASCSYPLIALVGPDESAVPEPATMTLIGTGLVMGVARRMRRRAGRA